MGIIGVDFDITEQLLILYSAFVKYLRKNMNKMRQCISSSQTSIKTCDLVRREILCKILIELGIPMKLVSLTKICHFNLYLSPGRQIFA
jgi:hypothetical protein